MKTIEYLNPGQIALDKCDHLVHLQRKYNIEIQKDLNQVNIYL